MSPCLFCQSPSADVTIEHTLSKPIGDLLGPGTRFTFDYWTVDEGGVHRRPTHESDRVTYERRAYCEACNGGWMQEMDKDVVPIIAPMVRGVQTTLSPEEQLKVATWATKIGLVYESLSGSRRLVPDAVYKWFFDHRQPIPDQPVQLARYVSDASHLHIRREIVMRDWVTSAVNHVESVLLAVILRDYVALTVFPVQPSLIVLPRDGSDRLTISPVRSHDVTWPPPVYYEPDTLIGLVNFDFSP